MTWHCVYCGAEVADERSAHCGEVGHTQAEEDLPWFPPDRGEDEQTELENQQAMQLEEEGNG